MIHQICRPLNTAWKAYKSALHIPTLNSAKTGGHLSELARYYTKGSPAVLSSICIFCL